MQEGGQVGFDIAYPNGDFTLEEMALLFSMAAAGYCGWRFLIWAARKWRERIDWKQLRRWFPISMASSTGGLLVLAVLIGGGPLWQDALPAALTVAGIVWLACYSIVRLVEWRTWSGERVALNLSTTRKYGGDG